MPSIVYVCIFRTSTTLFYMFIGTKARRQSAGGYILSIYNSSKPNIKKELRKTSSLFIPCKKYIYIYYGTTI